MSFSASLSGLNASQQKLNVIGNNLANINTVGFKSSSVQFSDLVSQSVGGSSFNPMQVGLGVTTGAISPVFTQGGFDNTGVATNVAIQGSGFFVVGSGNDQSYTRAGNFSFDANGMLVTSDGLPVQGYTAVDPTTGAILTGGSLTNIVIPPGTLLQPIATSEFQTVTNLNATAAAGDTFTSSVQLVDSLGTTHVATITYTNTAAGEWSYDITVPGEEVSGGTAGTPSSILAAPGSVTFDGDGKLTAVDGVTPPADVSITSPTWANGATPGTLTWNVVLPSGNATLSGFTSASATTSVNANGTTAGTIDSISINKDGELVASFGAGKSMVVAQLALATFNNPQGLVKLGGNRFGTSDAAGQANIGTPAAGGRGSIVGNTLEQSNVDIAQEFTQMILAQRGYQANSKSITVADEVLMDTLQLKR
jgi:flagellar hook protein FlgE